MSANDFISNQLAINLRQKIGFDPYDNNKFFDPNTLARKYAEIFGIKPNDTWLEAFRIVTAGQGGEINKINSLISSSLLSLLVFHKLFLGSDTNVAIEIQLPINGEKRKVAFNLCLFEVRNKVIKTPSCVDVVLYSEDNHILLFLESKFVEYHVTTFEEKYGKSYIDLYHNYLNEFLKENLELGDRKDKLIIKAKQDKCYIEGIKQTISHLIGLVKGPSVGGRGYYPQKYYTEYSKLYHDATELYYGTILYDPSGLKVDDKLYNDYKTLYINTIGKHGFGIVDGIREWCKAISPNEKRKDIVILNTPLTYQSLLKDDPLYKNVLPENVIKFYNFK